jgi:hypothetical protein
MSKFLSLCLLLILGLSAYAQDYVDLIRFRYDNTPLNQFDSSTASTRIEEFTLDATLPIVIKNNNAIITGFDLQSLSTKVNPTIPDLTSVYTILVKLGVNLKHSEKWSGTYMFLPKLSSDLKEISAKDFQYGAYVLLKYAKTAHLNYQFGMYYNSELFGPFFVPLLGLYYLSPSNKLEINATLPVWADINYRLKPWFRVGLSFSAFVRSYYINEPQFTENGEYLVKSTNEPMLYLQFEALKSLVIQTKIGYSIGRQYAIYDESDKVTFGFSAFRFGGDQQQLNSNFSDGMIFEARLIYRYHIDQDQK